jgi:hypothetical protein
MNDETGLRSNARLTRRAFLVAGGVVAAGIGLYVGTPSLHGTLTAFVDTLIPEDEFGPSASQTGVVDVLEGALEGNRKRRFQVAMTLAWLNMRARGSFAGADLEVRNALVAEMAAMPRRTWRRDTYMYVRERAMLHYYGDASRALALGFVGPPQPYGHEAPWAPWAGVGKDV